MRVARIPTAYFQIMKNRQYFFTNLCMKFEIIPIENAHFTAYNGGMLILEVIDFSYDGL